MMRCDHTLVLDDYPYFKSCGKPSVIFHYRKDDDYGDDFIPYCKAHRMLNPEVHFMGLHWEEISEEEFVVKQIMEP
jgi:hypothetical protein